jgi:hypothetical protein
MTFFAPHVQQRKRSPLVCIYDWKTHKQELCKPDALVFYLQLQLSFPHSMRKMLQAVGDVVCGVLHGIDVTLYPTAESFSRAANAMGHQASLRILLSAALLLGGGHGW